MSEEQRQEAPPDDNEQENDNETPHLSTSFFLFILAAGLILVPIYARFTGTIVALLFHILAAIFLFISVCYFIGELVRTPQLRRFLLELLPWRDVFFPWRPTSDILATGLALTFFVGLSLLVHHLAFSWLELTGILAAIARAIVIVLAFLAATVIFASVEESIIKPLLRFVSSNDDNVRELTRRTRRLILAIVGILGFIATLLQLNDVFR